MRESSKRAASKPVKPEKPFDGFPLTVNGNGQWSKKLRGKVFYFGTWDDWEGALEEYQRDWPAILKTGQRPFDGVLSADEDANIGGLCDAFVEAKRHVLDSGELSLRSLQEYEESAAGIVDYFGRDRTLDSLGPADFDKFRAKLSVGPKGKRSPVTLSRHVRIARMVFKYAEDAGLVEGRVRFGPHFKQPSKRTLRLDRQSRDKRMFGAAEIRRMLKAAKPVMRSMILLGINCGFGDTDLANLPQSAVDLESGWAEFPRPKTGVERRCPLWPETVEALREAIEKRPQAKQSDDDGLCFLTQTGRRWVRNSGAGKQRWVDSLGQEFKKLMGLLGINGNRGFYSLRHCFETVAGETTDQVCVNSIMGHVDNSMAGVYRERISDERSQAVVETVRVWLWPDGAPSYEQGASA